MSRIFISGRLFLFGGSLPFGDCKNRGVHIKRGCNIVHRGDQTIFYVSILNVGSAKHEKLFFDPLFRLCRATILSCITITQPERDGFPPHTDLYITFRKAKSSPPESQLHISNSNLQPASFRSRTTKSKIGKSALSDKQ